MVDNLCFSRCCHVTLIPGTEVLKVIVRMCDHGCSRDSVLAVRRISPAAIEKLNICRNRQKLCTHDVISDTILVYNLVEKWLQIYTYLNLAYLRT